MLLDNGRTKVLADEEKREALYCIRCGACLNTCPVYRKIGGHSFPWVYSGPIGAIITPQFMGTQARAWSTLRVQPLWRLRRSMSGQNRHPESAAGPAGGSGQSAD